MAPMTPLPAFQERKDYGAKKDMKFRKVLEKRATKWEGENDVLGHHVKQDVNRPKALLAVSAAGLKVKGEEEANDDDKLRAEIWNARSVIDKGYLSLLTLLELQRLVTDNRVHDFKRAQLMQNDVLGHHVKQDVNRPKALLAVSAAGLKVKGEEEANDDDKLRAEIWNARSVFDKGCLSLLTLLEL